MTAGPDPDRERRLAGFADLFVRFVDLGRVEAGGELAASVAALSDADLIRILGAMADVYGTMSRVRLTAPHGEVTGAELVVVGTDGIRRTLLGTGPTVRNALLELVLSGVRWCASEGERYGRGA